VSAARDRLADDVARVLGPNHGVEIRLVEGGRRNVLISQSEGADLLVVDAPRTTDISAQTLFARKLLHQALCPVVVMPLPISGDNAADSAPLGLIQNP
jgi:hypothetical protein